MSEIELDPEVATFAATLNVHTVAANLLKLKKSLTAAYHEKDDDLLGALIATNAMFEFIKETYGSPPDPLTKLMLALMDLHNGTHTPLLKPRAAGPGKPNPMGLDFLRAHVAFAMQMLVSLGYHRKEAASFVGSVLDDIGINKKIGRKHTIGAKTTVKQWRDDAMQGDPNIDIDAELYRMLQQTFAIAPGTGREVGKKQVLQNLADGVCRFAVMTPEVAD